MTGEISAIYFDLDDTLIPSSGLYSEAMSRIGIDSSSVRYINARLEVKRNLDKSNPSRHNRVLYLKKWVEKSERFNPDKILQLINRYEEELENLIRAAWVKSGYQKLLRKLGRRYPLGVITNETTRMQLIKMRAIDPEGHFLKWLITSEEAGAEKPDPRIFNLMIGKSGVAAKDILLIGDDWEADILGFRQLGGNVIWKNSAFSQTSRENIQVIQNLFDLEDLLL